MAEQLCQVIVNNTPVETKDYIVARFDAHTRQLWYWGSWDNEPQANEIAKMVDGIVVRRMKNERI